ncbi:hypothetical protein SFRURICE_009614 [Spodoptera frugiperda]|nr:hypothetical protein SFRURICE_009614 [Spodoptera frugiperda]
MFECEIIYDMYLQYSMQHHAFYPRKGRLRCTLRHVPPYNYKSHVIGGMPIPIFFEKPKRTSNILPDPGIEPKTPGPTQYNNQLISKSLVSQTYYLLIYKTAKPI